MPQTLENNEETKRSKPIGSFSVFEQPRQLVFKNHIFTRLVRFPFEFRNFFQSGLPEDVSVTDIQWPWGGHWGPPRTQGFGVLGLPIWTRPVSSFFEPFRMVIQSKTATEKKKNDNWELVPAYAEFKDLKLLGIISPSVWHSFERIPETTAILVANSDVY